MNKTTALQMLVERITDWPTKIKQLTSSLPGWVWRVDANDNIVLVVSHVQLVDIAYTEDMITESEWMEAVPSCGPPGDVISTREEAMTTLRVELVQWPVEIHTSLPMPTGWVWVHLPAINDLPMLTLKSESDLGRVGNNEYLMITFENFNGSRADAIDQLKTLGALELDPSEGIPLTREEAIAHLVEFVTMWPGTLLATTIAPHGWRWVVTGAGIQLGVTDGSGVVNIDKETWATNAIYGSSDTPGYGYTAKEIADCDESLSKGYEVDDTIVELKVLPDIVGGNTRLRRDEAVEYCNENYYKWPMSKLDVLSNAPPHGWDWVTIGDEQALKSIKGYAYIIRDSLDKFAQEHCDILDDGMSHLASDLTGTLRPKQERYLDSGGDDWIDEFARIATPEEFRGAMMFTIGKYQRRLGKKDSIKNEVEKIADYGSRWAQYENQQTPEF